MKNYFKLLRGDRKGFTLIELLVVIGILGILAAALITTIDPFEQIKKAQDANTKNTVVEFVDANVRYYSTHNQIADACTQTMGALAVNDPCLSTLVADGELKAAFTTASDVYTNIRFKGDDNSMTGCFQPVSKSQRKDPNTKYLSTGVPSATCATLTTCYWCAL